MKVAIIYTSVTGNTRDLVDTINQIFLRHSFNVEVFSVTQFPYLNQLNRFDAIVVGTYTWGDGDVPMEMKELFHAFEKQDVKSVTTGIVGTGDSFYPKFCGAVDEFRDMLYVQTNLAATLKIELVPQLLDLSRCERFVMSMILRIERMQEERKKQDRFLYS
ncbi:flavodoxin domain-containing protein [Cytobacillus sp. FJAT-54145]|uniref:Flavodoxin domain-containing protein n=1 Tax=Cytobacillus spartinae TaxID=3299023 RepID=A0ABW6K8Y4_9BACI